MGIRDKGYHGDIMGISWGYHGISWGYHGEIPKRITGILWGYYGYKVVLEQSDVELMKVEFKLGHWPNTALSFISSLTNKMPV